MESKPIPKQSNQPAAPKHGKVPVGGKDTNKKGTVPHTPGSNKGTDPKRVSSPKRIDGT